VRRVGAFAAEAQAVRGLREDEGRTVALLVGALLALAVGLLASAVGLDRDRAFYPTVTIVIASYYALFAVMGASAHVLVLESLVAATFLAVAVTGFRSSLWVVVAALAAHGLFDLAHGVVISNPGVPGWWREFCLTYDVTAAGYLAWLLKSMRIRATA
jgi:hypothetical protein